MPATRDRSNGQYASGTDGVPPDGELLAEQTTQQGFNIPLMGHLFGMVGGGTSYACGNSGNPCGFPGWGGLYRGTYETYRLMASHCKIAHARSVVFNPILAATWNLEFDKQNKPPEAWQKLIRDVFFPKRTRYMQDHLWGVDFGNSCAEQIWTIKDGMYWLDDLKPLHPEWTTIVTSRTGEVLGLSQGAYSAELPVLGTDDQGGGAVRGLGPFKSFLYTYNMRGGRNLWYGHSRHENNRPYAWRDWLDTAQQLNKLGNKLVGTYLHIQVPGATFRDPSTGKETSYFDDAVTKGQRMLQGDFAYVTSSLWPKDEKNVPWEVKLELLEKSHTKLDALDMGDNSAAITGLIARLTHDEGLMFEGWLQSPRTGGESLHGSRADAAEHTETGKLDSQLIAWQLDDALSTVVDDVLVLNFGERARGRIRLRTVPLDDTTSSDSKKLLGILATANKAFAARLADTIDMNKLIEDSGYEIAKRWEDTEAPPDTGADPNAADPSVATPQRKLIVAQPKQ